MPVNLRAGEFRSTGVLSELGGELALVWQQTSETVNEVLPTPQERPGSQACLYHEMDLPRKAFP